MTSRIRVVGGPWPERIGCVGSVVTPTPERAKRYPFAGRHKADVIIHLDDDPLARSTPNPFNDERDLWTCAIGRKDVVHIQSEEVAHCTCGDRLTDNPHWHKPTCPIRMAVDDPACEWCGIYADDEEPSVRVAVNGDRIELCHDCATDWDWEATPP
jgi:hypothetical protein